MRKDDLNQDVCEREVLPGVVDACRFCIKENETKIINEYFLHMFKKSIRRLDVKNITFAEMCPATCKNECDGNKKHNFIFYPKIQVFFNNKNLYFIIHISYHQVENTA